jgi:hypothetical membrane protein
MHKGHTRGIDILVTSILLAIVYNSWLLGFILNNPVVHHDLSSQLEVAGQPYNWLFVSADVMTGLLSIILVCLLWANRTKKHLTSAMNVIVIGLIMFGLFTAISALLPLSCQTSDTRCGAHLSQTFGIHDVTGGIASFGLFISLAGAWLYSGKVKPNLSHLVVCCTTILWCVAGIAYLVFTVVNKYTVGIQQIFLILSGVAIIVIGISTQGLLSTRKTATPHND